MKHLFFIPVDITEDVVVLVAHRSLGSSGPGGTDLEALHGWILKLGEDRKRRCISFDFFTC